MWDCENKQKQLRWQYKLWYIMNVSFDHYAKKTAQVKKFNETINQIWYTNEKSHLTSLSMMKR